MKRKNFMLKFGLSMVVIVLPILLIVYGILIASLYKNKKGFILSMSLSFVLGIFLVFLITIGIGFLLYEKTNYEIEEDKTTISNGLVVAKKRILLKLRREDFYSYIRMIFIVSLGVA